ncbi:unnamed protein product, partial [Owenia fusiformis]
GLYQDTKVPIDFNSTITLMGTEIPASDLPHIGLEFYLTDDSSSLTPSDINEGAEIKLSGSSDVMIDQESYERLKGSLENMGEYTVIGNTEIEIASDWCSHDPLFVCMKYVIRDDFHVDFREGDETNDFDCINVTALVLCTDATRDLSPIKFNFWDTDIEMDSGHRFELLVDVDLRGNVTTEPLWFESKIYLSVDRVLDAMDTQIPYVGFKYGLAKDEMQRPLVQGKHTFNMGSVPLVIPSGVEEKYCGHTYLIVQVDTDVDDPIAERYENNNEKSTAINLYCPRDNFVMSDIDIEVEKPLWPGSPADINLDVTIRNVGEDLPLATRYLPHYVLKVYASDGLSYMDSNKVNVTPIQGWTYPEKLYYSAMPTGDVHILKDLKGQLNFADIDVSVCESMAFILVCVEKPGDPTTETILHNNCKAVKIEDDDKNCEARDGQRDIELIDFRLPSAVSPLDTIDISLVISMDVQPNARPIVQGDFISAIFLSLDEELNVTQDYKWIQLANNASAQRGERKFADISQNEVTLTELGFATLCGDVFVFFLLDSEQDIEEYKENNNYAMRSLAILCENDQLSLSNVKMSTEFDQVFTGHPTPYELQVDVMCTQAYCNYVRSTENVKFLIGTLFDESDVAPLPLFDVDELNIGVIGSNVRSVEPSLGAEFHGHRAIQRYSIKGEIELPADRCREDGTATLNILVDFGSSLSDESDIVQMNNYRDIIIKCGPVKAMRDLVAHPVKVLGGETLHSGRPVYFSLPIELRGTPLNPMNAAPNATRFQFSFYLSEDDKLSVDDLKMMYKPSTSISRMMGLGLQQGLTTLKETFYGIRLPNDQCGKQFF